MSEIKFGEIIFSQEQIETRAREIGQQISEDYKGESVVLVGILRGAVLWMAQVLKSIDIDVEIDFMAVSSYGDATSSSGIVKINKDLEWSIEGRHVIIVEDIVDSGITLSYLVAIFKSRRPKSLKICSLLSKPSRRVAPLDIDYLGFEVDDVFIIGYGLDLAQKYRNLPYVTSVVE
jgi:hypoxanthine phosphoribosyltransferase